MKFALWVIFALIAALWSGIVLISAELTKWLAANVSLGKPNELISNPWPVPAWLRMWIDPTVVEGFQANWVHVLDWLGQTGPSIEGIVSWLIPVLWVTWGVVLLIALLAAVAGHLLINKLCRSKR